MKVFIAFTLLTLIVSGDCGHLFQPVADNVRGSLDAIKEHFHNKFHSEEKHEAPVITEGAGGIGERSGLINKIHDSIRYNVVDKIDGFVFGATPKPSETGNGLIKNVHDVIKNKIDKVDEFIFGGTRRPAVASDKEANNVVNSNCGNKCNPVQETTHKDTIDNKTELINSKDDGEGLIDVRMAITELDSNKKENQTDYRW